MRERNRRFSLWLNDKEFEYLTKQAEIAGLKKEPFIRKLIMGKEIRPRPPGETAQISAVRPSASRHASVPEGHMRHRAKAQPRKGKKDSKETQ